MTKLSLVVPCFNGATTLVEAVESVYRQAPVFPFDLTLIDDGSTDSTYEVMQGLRLRHRNIRLLRHKENLGGGAARNTAIRSSDGELIFCLDADDILGPGFLENLTRYWNHNRCDGLGMSTSVKFRGHDIQDVTYVDEFDEPGKRVRFESFLGGGKCSLGVVFMMRRAAFERIGGYPTEHGFDTQGMAFRFLCHGQEAYTCPNTVYYHRVALPRSYYKREETAGRLNWNWFNVFDEFLYLFGREAQTRMLEHPLFDVPGEASAVTLLKQVTATGPMYASQYRRLVRKGPEAVARDFHGAKAGVKRYWLGNFHRLRGRPATALAEYTRALALGFDYWIVYYRMLQAELALTGNGEGPEAALEELLLRSRPYPTERRPLVQRVFHRILYNPQLREPAIAIKTLKDRLVGRRSA